MPRRRVAWLRVPDAIRDDGVWKKTKAAANQAGGFSLKVLAAVATGIAVQAGKKYAGLP